MQQRHTLALWISLAAAWLLLTDALGNAMENCLEQLRDGGFEASDLAWRQQSAGGYSLITQDNPRSGAWGAYLGGTDGADDRIEQTLTLPGDATAITLRFWWSMETDEVGGPFDTLTVTLRDAAGALLATLLAADSAGQADRWDETEADLTAYRGQTVTLRFYAVTDGTNPTSFFIDDAGILACAETSSSTSTPSATPTAEPSATSTPAASLTPTASATPTAEPSATSTPTGSATPTASATPTLTPLVKKTPASPTPSYRRYLPIAFKFKS